LDESWTSNPEAEIANWTTKDRQLQKAQKIHKMFCDFCTFLSLAFYGNGFGILAAILSRLKPKVLSEFTGGFK
jgi:hypothetical protein